jgi:hypothetical protein
MLIMLFLSLPTLQGEGCARQDIPGVYARVSGGIDWIAFVVCDCWDMPDAGFCSAERSTSGMTVCTNDSFHNKFPHRYCSPTHSPYPFLSNISALTAAVVAVVALLLMTLVPALTPQVLKTCKYLDAAYE